MVSVRNKFDTPQKTSERHALNDKYENFVITYIETVAECIPTKPRAKWRVPWESIAVWEKLDYIKKRHLDLLKET